MKKLAIFLFFVTFAALFGGYDLKLDGKFRNLDDNGLPENWYISDTGAAKMVPGKEREYQAVQITAENKEVIIRSRNAFKVDKRYFLKVDAEVKGNGSGFIGVEVFNRSGQKIAFKKLKNFSASSYYKDVECKVKISEISAECDAVKIVIGINENSVVSVCDIEAEVDDD